jgi:hypothetical protein
MKMFELYRVKENKMGMWVNYTIEKRSWLFFYRPLVHNKSVIYRDGHSATSRETLLFQNKEQAQVEIDRLRLGHGQITRKVWEGGELIHTERATEMGITTLSIFVLLVQALVWIAVVGAVLYGINYALTSIMDMGLGQLGSAFG